MREARAAAFTRADAYKTVTSLLMVAMGIVILARTLPLGFHLQALLVGGGFIGLGAYRLSFVVAYLRHRAAASSPPGLADAPGRSGRGSRRDARAR